MVDIQTNKTTQTFLCSHNNKMLFFILFLVNLWRIKSLGYFIFYFITDQLRSYEQYIGEIRADCSELQYARTTE